MLTVNKKGCPKWYYTTFTEKAHCPKPLKKESFIEKQDINFENIPEEQRKVLLQVFFPDQK